MPSPPADLSPAWNHVFVDFENVHRIDFAALGSKPATFTLLVGPKQARLDTGLVEALMNHAGAVQLIRLTSSGKNALDFALAYYVGRAAVVDPTGYFHIVSKDQGFDPLIEHLKSRRIRAYRHDDCSTLSFAGPPEVAVPAASTAAPSPPPTRPAAQGPAALALVRALEHLKKNPNNRPKREKTLASYLKNLLGKTATEAEVEKLTLDLKTRGHVKSTDKGAVTYHLLSS